MARITEKNSRRFRVQFTMHRELYELYEASQIRAASQCLIIDFNQDFEDWFGQQLQQVQKELDRLEVRQPHDFINSHQ